MKVKLIFTFVLQTNVAVNMDWSACVICGRTDGDLKCPARYKASDTALNFYNDFLRNVQGFREINAC